MNRWDEIKAAALDVAQHVTQDPAKRNAMADDLITLVGLMVSAVGKGVAVDGEADMNDARMAAFPWDDGSFDPTPELAAEAAAERATDEANGYTRYLTGEALQSQADHVVTEARNADLLRYDRPVWRPRCTVCGERNGHAGDCRNAPCGATPDGPACDWDRNCPQHGVQRCGECNRAEGDGHARGCRLAGCVAVHLTHDLPDDPFTI